MTHPVQHLIDQAKETVHDTAGQLGERAFNARLLTAQRELNHQLAQQEKQLQTINRQLERLAQQRQGGGGIPWLLIGLIGAGVYVWRTPRVRSQALELLGQVSPQARDTVEKVGGQAEQALDDVQGGKSPAETVKQAGRDVSQQVRDSVQDTKEDVKDAVNCAGDERRR